MARQFKYGDVVFGKWTVVKQIGEGSFGTVYEINRVDCGTTYRSGSGGCAMAVAGIFAAMFAASATAAALGASTPMLS